MNCRSSDVFLKKGYPLQVEVGEVVQEGTFGRVYRGVYRDPYARAALTVIIKTVSGKKE